jgi:hypothetical protein
MILWCVGVWEGRSAPDKHAWYYNSRWLAFEAFPQLSMWNGQASVRRRVEILGFPRPPRFHTCCALSVFLFITLRYILSIPLKHWAIFPTSSTSTTYFSNSHVVYTPDHEVVPRPCHIYDWLLNSSRDGFGLHPRQKFQSDHGLWDPQKTYFNACIIRWHAFAVGEAKEVL